MSDVTKHNLEHDGSSSQIDPAALVDDMDRLQALMGLAEAAAQQTRYADAVQHFREAAALARECGDLEMVARCFARMSWALWQSGANAEAAQACNEGLSSLTSAPPSHGLALLYQEAARANAFVGSESHARALAKRALEIARVLNIPAIQAEALNTLSMASWGFDPPPVLIEMARDAVAISDTHNLVLAGGRAHNNLGTGLSKLGRFREARFHFRRAVELNIQLDFNIGILFGMANGASMSIYLGEIRDARKQVQALRPIYDLRPPGGAATYLVRVVELRAMRLEGKLDDAYQGFTDLYYDALEAKSSQEMIEALSWLADLAYDRGELDKVLPALEQAPEESFNMVFSIMSRAYLALAYAQQDRWQEVKQTLEAAHWLNATIPGNWAEVYLKLVEARIAVLQGRVSEGLALYDALLDESMKREMRWHHAHLRTEIAEVALAAERRSHAIYSLREAYAEFNAIGADYYAKQAIARVNELA